MVHIMPHDYGNFIVILSATRLSSRVAVPLRRIAASAGCWAALAMRSALAKLAPAPRRVDRE
jgi:hypothetical protein